MHYTYIVCITINSVIKIEAKNYSLAYLGECKYRIKKVKMTRFIEAALKLESQSQLESDTE